MSNSGYDKLIRKYEDYRKDLPGILETRILEETAAVLQNKVRKRIFEEGLDSNDNVISQNYSTNPITVKKETFIKPSAFTGKKTMKLNYGYKELRDIQALPTNRVNLDYSGSLKNSLRVARNKKSIVIGINDRHNIEKAKSLEQRYKTRIFAFSQDEIKENFKIIFHKIKEVQREYFNGR
ncbi:hypothetical protein N6B72_05145 [Chryseobacterium soli]|uniref:hypothetical protein n=1 Tax=Chryseobacterium soli TaxID=445961 RepID=UPI002955D5E4|nr:hypothetical protein [Chryseobacterium soli]MDV7696301.1 hypothetical protein [Chryseobacterium soli]